MIGFYKKNIHFLEIHAVDADKRRFTNPAEAPRHFMDMEFYKPDSYPADSIPHSYDKAIQQYGPDSMTKHGILPWHIEHTYYRLRKAFEDQDAVLILHYSSDLGHYVGDAHVPLHTTHNYNGQLTHQEGIHAFWESRIPELMNREYEFFTGRALYLKNVKQYVWKAIQDSYLEKDSVLETEARLNKEFPADLKYNFENKGKSLIKVYSDAYTRTYSERLNHMIERRIAESVRLLGSLWYTAWVDAGQPDLYKLINYTPADSVNTKETDIDTCRKLKFLPSIQTAYPDSSG
ncbi:MAG: zinc dependent phospholipase C family protein [Bacteroidia bacterium]